MLNPLLQAEPVRVPICGTDQGYLPQEEKQGFKRRKEVEFETPAQPGSVKQVRFSVPTAADERDAQRLIFISGKEARFRDRQSNGSGTSCFQEIAASHISGKSIPGECRNKSGWTVDERQN